MVSVASNPIMAPLINPNQKVDRIPSRTWSPSSKAYDEFSESTASGSPSESPEPPNFGSPRSPSVGSDSEAVSQCDRHRVEIGRTLFPAHASHSRIDLNPPPQYPAPALRPQGAGSTERFAEPVAMPPLLMAPGLSQLQAPEHTPGAIGLSREPVVPPPPSWDTAPLSMPSPLRPASFWAPPPAMPPQMLASMDQRAVAFNTCTVPGAGRASTCGASTIPPPPAHRAPLAMLPSHPRFGPEAATLPPQAALVPSPPPVRSAPSLTQLRASPAPCTFAPLLPSPPGLSITESIPPAPAHEAPQVPPPPAHPAPSLAALNSSSLCAVGYDNCDILANRVNPLYVQKDAVLLSTDAPTLDRNMPVKLAIIPKEIGVGWDVVLA